MGNGSKGSSKAAAAARAARASLGASARRGLARGPAPATPSAAGPRSRNSTATSGCVPASSRPSWGTTRKLPRQPISAPAAEFITSGHGVRVPRHPAAEVELRGCSNGQPSFQRHGHHRQAAPAGAGIQCRCSRGLQRPRRRPPTACCHKPIAPIRSAAVRSTPLGG
jgi:hypothetical protein